MVNGHPAISYTGDGNPDLKYVRATDTDVYGVGAFLLAGSEVHGLLELSTVPSR